MFFKYDKMLDATIIIIIIIIIILLFIMIFTQNNKKFIGGLKTSINPENKFIVTCIDNMTNALVLQDKKAVDWCFDNIEELYIKYVDFYTRLSEYEKFYGSAEDKLWSTIPVAEALVVLYTNLSFILIPIKVVGAGSFNIAWEVKTVDKENTTSYILRTCRIKQNENTETEKLNTIDNIKQLKIITDLFAMKPYFPVIGHGSHLLEQHWKKPNRYDIATYWILTDKYEPITFELLTKDNNMEKYIETMINIRNDIHKEGYVYMDWKIINLMFDSPSGSFILTDLELIPVESNNVAYTHNIDQFKRPNNVNDMKTLYFILDDIIILKEMIATTVGASAYNIAKKLKRDTDKSNYLYWNKVHEDYNVNVLLEHYPELTRTYAHNPVISNFLIDVNDLIHNYYLPKKPKGIKGFFNKLFSKA